MIISVIQWQPGKNPETDFPVEVEIEHIECATGDVPGRLAEILARLPRNAYVAISHA